MYSIRKWIFRPKKSDTSLLAQFFYTDEELNMVAAELDSFDGRKDPERCTALVNHLRVCQDKVLTIVEKIMQETIPNQRAPRDFRVKFPDDVLQESLAGQLWFGAECLAAGSSIMNREVESASMRPLAKALTRHLDYLRTGLRDQCLKNLNIYSDTIKESLIVFDRLFAEFELSYVSAMVPVKTMKEYEMMQDVVVLFCETVNRAMKLNLLTQDMIDDYDPALMFTIPRLAIVCGLLVFPEGPLNPDMDPMSMSEMFRPFQTLLYKIRELLWTLSKQELWLLEKSLCSAEEPGLYRDIQPIELEEDLAQANAMELGQPANQSDAAKPDHSDGSEAEGSNAPVSGAGFLGVDNATEYRMITHSPSTITVVANSSCSSSDDVSETSRQRYLSVESAPALQHSMPHQDSIDSGMLSGSDLAAPASPTFEEKRERERQRLRRCLGVRQLRQSRSWPEGQGDYTTRRARKVHGDIQEGAEDHRADVHRVSYANRSGSQEFNFNLPLNTEVTLHNEVIPATSSAPGQRLIYTERRNVGSGAEGGQQVSFVTDILNEVFVTDSTFQGSGTPPDAPETGNVCNCDSDVKSDSDCSEDDVFVPAKCQCSSHKITDPENPKSQQDHDHTNLQIDDCHFEEEEENGEETTTPKCGPHSSNTSCSKPTSNKLVSSKGDRQDCNDSHSFSGQDQERGRKGSFTARFAGEEKVVSADCLDVPKIQKLKYGETVSSAMVRSHSPSMDCDWDRESYCSSDTSSYNSECNDDEEIALAIQAAELAARREARARFRSSADLIHRLFVCISGVADQLQTNYASDLRNILKAVFECYASDPVMDLENAEAMAATELQSSEVSSSSQQPEDDSSSSEDEDSHTDLRDEVSRAPEEAPTWVPDDEAPHCTSCRVPFTFVRRRHHCRNCGKIFCSRCSSNSVPLPHYGHDKPVRVCNHCFVFQVTPFTVDG